MNFFLHNPIPRTIKDPDELSQAFIKYGIIPWYGTDEYTSHKWLDFLFTITNLSPTFKAVRKEKVAYTFGLRASLVGTARPGLALERSELPESQQLQYEQFLAEHNIRLKHILKYSKRLDHHLEVSGNAFLIIRRISVGDTVRYEFEVPHFKHVAYLDSQDEAQEFLIISKFLNDHNRLLKFPPRILRVTEEDEPLEWNAVSDQVWEAVIHIKEENEAEESDFYSRPEIIATLDWMFVDIKLGSLAAKIAATDIITKKILAFEGPDPETELDDETEELEELDSKGNIGKRKVDRFTKAMGVLKELTTEIGNPANTGGIEVSSIVGIEYPGGRNAPIAIDLEMNRDTKYHQFLHDTTVSEICASMQWSAELINRRQASATLGGNLYYDIFTSRNTTCIQPRQVKFEDIWNGVLSQIAVLENQPRFENYGIQLPNVIGTMLEEIKATNQVQDTRNQQEDEGQEASINQTPTEDGNDNDPE